LIERYSPPRIREIWSDRHRFELWLRVEQVKLNGPFAGVAENEVDGCAYAEDYKSSEASHRD